MLATSLKVGDVLYSKSLLLRNEVEPVTILEITKDENAYPVYFNLSDGNVKMSTYKVVLNYIKAKNFDVNKFFSALDELKTTIFPYLKKESNPDSDYVRLAISACFVIFSQFDFNNDDLLSDKNINSEIQALTVSGGWSVSSLRC